VASGGTSWHLLTAKSPLQGTEKGYERLERVVYRVVDPQWNRIMAKKETIKPPSLRELKDASKQLRGGHSSGGRTMADQSVAVRQGVSKPSSGKKR
jgi:hypothetical protein